MFNADHCSAVMVTCDITEAKGRGEERQLHLFALQEAEHQYRSMFEHAPLGDLNVADLVHQSGGLGHRNKLRWRHLAP